MVLSDTSVRIGYVVLCGTSAMHNCSTVAHLKCHCRHGCSISLKLGRRTLGRKFVSPSVDGTKCGMKAQSFVVVFGVLVSKLFMDYIDFGAFWFILRVFIQPSYNRGCHSGCGTSATLDGTCVLSYHLFSPLMADRLCCGIFVAHLYHFCTQLGCNGLRGPVLANIQHCDDSTALFGTSVLSMAPIQPCLSNS